MSVTREQVGQWMEESGMSFFPNFRGDVIGEFDEAVALITLARADLEAKVAELEREDSEVQLLKDKTINSLSERIVELEAEVARLKETNNRICEAAKDEYTKQCHRYEQLAESQAEVARLKKSVNFYAAKKVLDQNDELRQQLAASQDEVARLVREVVNRNQRALDGDKSVAAANNLYNALAASQAREKVLRDAIDQFGHNKYCSRGIAIIENRNTTAECTCQMRVALSTPTDDAALREYCAAMVEKIAQLIQPEDSYQDDWFKAKADCYKLVIGAADKIRKGEEAL